MGKKKMAVLGTENEEEAKKKAAVKREQKKLREGKTAEPEVLKVSEPVNQAAEVSAEPETVEDKKSFKKIRVRTKNYQGMKSKVDVGQVYSLSDGIKLLREVSYAKFDPAVELHFVLKDKGVNRDVELPHSTGKTRRIAVADDETVAKIEKGQIDFDILISSPAQMGKLVKFAKVLGPRGLMPNPKNGTVVPDPEKTAKTMTGKNSIMLKTEKDAPLIHVRVGKLSMKDKELSENISAVSEALAGKTTKIVLKSTQSPAIKIAVA
jgi:large subunit ribosomal protein L1